jgi:hypothetical protein
VTLRLGSTITYLTLTCDVEVERFAELGLGADLALVGTGVRQLDPGDGETPPTQNTYVFQVDGLMKKISFWFLKLCIGQLC